MPTPIDEFPPIPEDDGSGGSGNESHEETHLKENKPPAAAAADTQSVKRLSDRTPSFERKNTAKHSTAERKSSNKLQRKGTLRRQVRWLHSHHLAVADSALIIQFIPKTLQLKIRNLRLIWAKMDRFRSLYAYGF